MQKIAKRKSDLRLYADELGKGLVGELDYTLEASNASEFLVPFESFNLLQCITLLSILLNLGRYVQNLEQKFALLTA